MLLNVAILLACGTYWGFSLALSRIVMEGGPNPLVMSFWQGVGASIMVWSIMAAMGRMPRITWEFVRFAAVIGVLGGALPGTLLYWAVSHIGAGVLSVCMATVPLMQFALSSILGLEKARAMRFVGLAIGMAAVWMIARPESGAAPFVWVAVAVGAAFSYTVENAFISSRRPADLAPDAILGGMVVVSAIILAPIMLITDDPWPFTVMAPGPREYAFLAFIIGSPFAYGGFVWMITRAGSVFAAQVAYVVTISGVLSGVWFLGEAYENGFWVAMAMMLVALSLGLPSGRVAIARAEE